MLKHKCRAALNLKLESTQPQAVNYRRTHVVGKKIVAAVIPAVSGPLTSEPQAAQGGRKATTSA